MKKNLFLWVLMAFGVMAFTACSEDDGNGGGGDGKIKASCYVVNQ